MVGVTMPLRRIPVSVAVVRGCILRRGQCLFSSLLRGGPGAPEGMYGLPHPTYTPGSTLRRVCRTKLKNNVSSLKSLTTLGCFKGGRGLYPTVLVSIRARCGAGPPPGSAPVPGLLTPRGSHWGAAGESLLEYLLKPPPPRIPVKMQLRESHMANAENVEYD